MTAGWRATPPALFPPLLGFLGLGLACRRGADTLGLPGWASELILALGGSLFVLVLVAYAAKLAARPGALLDDLKPPPARGTVAAASMGLLLLAAALVPWAPALARGVWYLGLLAHAGAAAAVALVLWRGRAGGVPVTPALFLPFVGQVAAPLAGVPLGERLLSAAILIGSVLPAALIAVLAIPRLIRHAHPPPQRPAAMILIAPPALMGLGWGLLGQPVAFTLFFILAIIGFAFLILRARWMAAGGFNPGWGAFTFPLAALAGVTLMAEQLLPGAGAGPLGLLILLLAIAVTPYVLARTLLAWRAGTLGPATGAAVA